jgi:hypothetical protein
MAYFGSRARTAVAGGDNLTKTKQRLRNSEQAMACMCELQILEKGASNELRELQDAAQEPVQQGGL